MGTWRYLAGGFDHWKIISTWHTVIHIRCIGELAVVIVFSAFKQGLANTLHHAAMYLSFHNHGVDYIADIINSNPDRKAHPIQTDDSQCMVCHSATSLSVYDSQGNAHTLTTYFVKTAANAWSVFAANDGVQIGAGAVGTINFNTDGSINTGATTLPYTISTAVSTGATTPLVFTLDFTASTQFGSSFGVNKLDQDGFQSGKLTGFSISEDGVVLGRYSNGQARAQGQIVLANFTNVQGLQPLGNSLWGETSASGQPLVGAPTTGNLGVLQSGATEESNVDITEELVKMITAQRVYQANAQTIKTQDQVLQTMVNLR